MDFEARQIIEALRSGVSSRAVGRCFTSARPGVLAEIDAALEKAIDTRQPAGMVISGKYGEGKTHLLNTTFSMAHDRNMVVSLVSLSKETPFCKLPLVYAKVIQGTYLPGRAQPGFGHLLDSITLDSPIASSLLEYALTALETTRLFYVFKSYLGTEDEEERFQLLADMEGDFVTSGALKQMYKRIFQTPSKEKAGFVKSRHTFDYFAFMSRLFVQLGYAGWVILFDEAELVGRLGKKARLTAYENISRFLHPGRTSAMQGVQSMFAFNASFVPDVIDAKHEHENLEASALVPDAKKAVLQVLNTIASSTQLAPLRGEEIVEILERIRELHGKAYGWNPEMTDEKGALGASEKRGYLLRTRIRAAVERLDQEYQYGAAGEVYVGDVGKMGYEEDEVVSLEEMMD